MLKILKLVFIFVFILVLNIAYSKPVIKGFTQPTNAISHNQTLIILGGEIKAKAKGSSIRFENFENNDLFVQAKVGNDLTDEITYWEDRDTQAPTISSDNNRGNSTRNVKTDLSVVAGSAGLSDKFWKNSIGLGDDKFFISYWIWYERDPGITLEDGRTAYQIKTVTISDIVNDGASGSEYAAFFTWTYNYPTAPYSKSYFSKSGGDSFYLTPTPFSATQIKGKWYNITIQVDQGDMKTANGSFETQHSSADFSLPYAVNTETGTIQTVNNKFDAIKLGWYMGASTIVDGSISLYYDDIYIDNSWARVEIGDNESYEHCTHREMQFINGWNYRVGNPDQTIEIIVNQGSFPNGEAFIFVVDEDGIPSTGIPINFQ